jgi:hypothetical protein
MYLDALLLVSNAQAVTATAVSTDKIDLGAVTPRRRIGTGEPMGFGVAIDVAADFTTGDETYQFNIVSDEDPALGSPTVIASFVRTAAQLAAGSLHFLPLPQDFPQERYLGLQFVTGGTSPSVTVTAWLTAHDLFSVAAVHYAKGYVITG